MVMGVLSGRRVMIRYIRRFLLPRIMGKIAAIKTGKDSRGGFASNCCLAKQWFLTPFVALAIFGILGILHGNVH